MFNSPHEDISFQRHFQEREVGITHPDVPGFVRIKNNGDIEIVAGEGLSITMSPKSKSITFVADHIKFLTKDEGMRWNRLQLNNRAVSFHEPTFIPIKDTQEGVGLYSDVNYFVSSHDDEDSTSVQKKIKESADKIRAEE